MWGGGEERGEDEGGGLKMKVKMRINGDNTIRHATSASCRHVLMLRSKHIKNFKNSST